MEYYTEILDSDKAVLINGDCTIKTKIIIKDYDDNGDKILTEQDSIKTWSLLDERYVPDEGFLGQFVAKQLDCELQNISDDFDIENKTIELYMGISQFNSKKDPNWYKLGTYIVDNPKDDEVEDNTKFTAYDLTVLMNKKFDANYTDDNLSTSLNDMLESGGWISPAFLLMYASGQCGIEVGSEYDFPNANLQLYSNQFTSGETCRDIIRYVSQIAFGYAELGWDDKLYIRQLSTDYDNIDTTYTITNDNYYSLKTQKKSYGPVNRVFIGLEGVDGNSPADVQDPDSVAQYGETALYIYNNPIVSSSTDIEISKSLESQAIEHASLLYGITYRPIEMETTGHPWLKAYEPIKVIDMQNNTIITYPFVNKLKYTGHIKSDISSEANTKIEDTYGYDDSIVEAIRRLGINVDHANHQISLINTSLGQLDSKYVQIGQEIDISQFYTKQQITDIVEGVGVDGVVVQSLQTASNTLDKNGLTVGRTDSATTTNVNSNGMKINNASNGNNIVNIDNSGFYGENVTSRTYLNFGTHGRFEKYRDIPTRANTTRIGCFWLERNE